MGTARVAKCWHCGQMRSLEWGPRTLCGNCKHEIVPSKRGCQCSACKAGPPTARQQELFDLATGKPLVLADDGQAGAAKKRKGATRD